MGTAVLWAASLAKPPNPALPILIPPIVLRLTALGNAVFAFLVLAHPPPHPLYVGVVDIALTLGLAAAGCLCLLPGRPNRGAGVPLRTAAVPHLLGLGVVTGAITAGFFGYYDIFTGRVIPPGTIADVMFVVSHALALPTLLLLPRTGIRGMMRLRTVLDGITVICVAGAFAWYFLIGPSLLTPHLSLLGKWSQVAYPISDLFLIACLLTLVSQLDNRAMQSTAFLLSGALVALLVTDSVFVFERLHHLYRSASVLDIGWLAGGTGAGLAALELRLTLAATGIRSGPMTNRSRANRESARLHFWRSVIPHSVVMSMVLFALYTSWHESSNRFAMIIYLVAAVTVLLTLLRQVLAAFESSHLIRRLEAAYARAMNRSLELRRANNHLEEAQKVVEERNASLAQANERLEHLATHDHLTDLADRSLLAARLTVAVHSARSDDGSLALLLIDLDAFRDINETFGQYTGDVILQQIAQRLTVLAPSDATVARFGADEFAVVLPGIGGRVAESLASAVLARIQQPIIVDDRPFEIDASVGVALYPDHGGDTESLLRDAGLALSHAKKTNAGSVLYSPDLDRRGPRRLTLASELRRAIAAGELVLHYQPKVDLASGTVAGYEALIRWQHPEHGLIPPATFLPIADRAGLMTPLTLWVIGTAQREWQRWRDDGQDRPIAVNVAPRSLYDPDLLDFVQSVTTADEAWLHVEITESSLVEDPIRALRVLNSMHDLGIQIAIDDFGTGYSSLSYLRHLPVDEIKIDQSFVREMAGNDEDRMIVGAIVDLAHNLGLRVTAEGVETELVAHTLRKLRCDLAQGYFFGAPVTSRETFALSGQMRVNSA
ncbi:MAG TPA: bifunctional diguanylate cyclase/phosphodiesterase [Chloroflexota bacterium]|nr:bifunctional diguanylate cyclase/phosphodiesterase [Chloroflexota bacterium]